MALNTKDPLDFYIQKVFDQASDTLISAYSMLSTKWAIIQISVILGCYAVSWTAARLIRPTGKGHLHGFESQPRLSRVLDVLLHRLHLIFFSLTLWASHLVLQHLSMPMRGSYVLIAASLSASFVAITVASRIIKNRSIANLFALAAWSIAALNILGLLDETAALLDMAALTIGQFRLSLLVIVKGVLWFAILVPLAAAVSGFAERRLRSNKDVAPALQVLISKFIKFILITVAVLATLTSMGFSLTTLTVFSGALGIGIGLGLQKVASNLLSGIIILMDRSIKPGDIIALGDTFGWISALKARYVSVVTRDGIEYLIPNEVFVSDRVINWSYSDRKVRVELKYGVSYDSNPHKVRELSAAAVTHIDRVLDQPPPVCHVTAFGDSSIDFVLRFWIEDPQNGLTNLRSAAFLALWDTFEKNGIKIPYPHREVIVRHADASELESFKPTKPARRRTRASTLTLED